MGVESGAADDARRAQRRGIRRLDRANATSADESTEPTSPEPRGTRLDDWWGACSRPRGDGRSGTGAGRSSSPLIAAVLRFWNLGHPQAIVFDETYYVKDAWTLLQNGYESSLARGRRRATSPPATPNIFNDDPSYVVHPPLGKWMISLGMAAVRRRRRASGGARRRRSRHARRAPHDAHRPPPVRVDVLAVIAGLLFAIDGNAIVHVARRPARHLAHALRAARVLVRAARPRPDAAARSSARLDAARVGGLDPHYGPALWAAAMGDRRRRSPSAPRRAVKWSGLWFLAAFGIYLVIVDALARRRAGVPFWLTGAVLKQAPITFLLLVPIAAAVYLASLDGLARHRRRLLPALGRRGRQRGDGVLVVGAARPAEPLALPRSRRTATTSACTRRIRGSRTRSPGCS